MMKFSRRSVVVASLVGALSALALGLNAPDGRAGETLFMPIADVFPMSGMGMVATGKIEQGTVSVGDKVELVGMRPAARATVLALQIGSASANQASAGDDVSVVLRGVDQDAIERGQTLATPGSVDAATNVTAEVTISADGRKKPVEDGFRPLVQLWTARVTATFAIGAPIAPGTSGKVQLVFEDPVAARVGDTFDIIDLGKTIGSGKILSVGK
jgi:elongation factor Tu